MGRAGYAGVGSIYEGVGWRGCGEVARPPCFVLASRHGTACERGPQAWLRPDMAHNEQWSIFYRPAIAVHHRGTVWRVAKSGVEERKMRANRSIGRTVLNADGYVLVYWCIMDAAHNHAQECKRTRRSVVLSENSTGF